MDPQSASVVISYVLSISFLISTHLIILPMEIKRTYFLKNKSKEDIWLNIWCITSIILFGFCMLLALLHKTPEICMETYYLGTIVWTTAQCTLTMFQTRRLQYTFHTQFKSTSVESLGYSQKIFSILYIFGTLLPISCYFYFPFFAYNIINHGIHGCQMLFKPGFFIIGPILLGLVLILDWTVMSLYIYGVYRLRKICNNSISTDENIKKATYIVRKILFLTVFFEISTIINVITFSWSDHPAISTAIHLFDSFISVIIVFLMRQHNDDYYKAVINKMCCCLSRMLMMDEIKNFNRYKNVSPQEMNDDDGEDMEGGFGVNEDQTSVGITLAEEIAIEDDDEFKGKRDSTITDTNNDSTVTLSNNGQTSTISWEYPQIDGSNTKDLLGSSMIMESTEES